MGAKAPGVLARAFPRWAARSRGKRLVAAEILQKLQERTPLDAIEVEYAARLLGGDEAKLLRQRQIMERAIKQQAEQESLPPLPERQPLALPEATPSPPAAEDAPAPPTDDWLAHFWEDASLVSDEMLQEAYAPPGAGSRGAGSGRNAHPRPKLARCGAS